MCSVQEDTQDTPQDTDIQKDTTKATYRNHDTLVNSEASKIKGSDYVKEGLQPHKNLKLSRMFSPLPVASWSKLREILGL